MQRKSAPADFSEEDYYSTAALDEDIEEDDESEYEKFKCLALQHRTKDCAATLMSDPKMVIFVHI